MSMGCQGSDETGAKWAILFVEVNDLVLDNHQDFTHKLKGPFEDLSRESQIDERFGSSSKDSGEYISDFFLLAIVGWNN